MKRLKAILGIVWAAAALPIVLGGFFGMDRCARQLVASTGIHISPWFTGGEAVRTTVHGGWQTIVHRPVFDGLFRDRPSGFIQVDWKPTGQAPLPQSIEESEDLDGDGSPDVRIVLDTRADHAEVFSLNQRPASLREVFNMGTWRAVRVEVKNPNRR